MFALRTYFLVSSFSFSLSLSSITKFFPGQSCLAEKKTDIVAAVFFFLGTASSVCLQRYLQRKQFRLLFFLRMFPILGTTSSVCLQRYLQRKQFRLLFFLRMFPILETTSYVCLQRYLQNEMLITQHFTDIFFLVFHFGNDIFCRFRTIFIQIPAYIFLAFNFSLVKIWCYSSVSSVKEQTWLMQDLHMDHWLLIKQR